MPSFAAVPADREVSRMRIPAERPPTPPGEMLLEEFLKPLGMTQADFAERIGVSYVRLNEIVNGRRGITPRPRYGPWAKAKCQSAMCFGRQCPDR
jgi:hypothetical protein